MAWPHCPTARARKPRGERESTIQLHFALTDWLRECSLSCDVDRLRWFLRDVENFCHTTFGGHLTTAREHREVRDFILENDDNLLAALAVLEAYPATRDEVIAGFLDRLCERITRDLQQEGLEAESYFADNWREDGVWVYRSSWEGDSSTPYVWLGHDSPNARGWWLGVGFHPRGTEDPRIESLRKPLADSLGRPSQKSDNFPWFRYLDPHRDWAPMLVANARGARAPRRVDRALRRRVHRRCQEGRDSSSTRLPSSSLGHLKSPTPIRGNWAVGSKPLERGSDRATPFASATSTHCTPLQIRQPP